MQIKQKTIPKNWCVKKIEDVLNYERPDKYIVKSTHYSKNFKVPVLTANKSFVLGYTNEDSGIYEDLPVIIFDDFTTARRYVDFSFKIKSSAIKILKPKDKSVNLKFIHELMNIINFTIGNHKRYYISEYQKIDIILPPPEEQEKIVEILETVDKEIENVNEVIKKNEKMKKGLMKELLTKGIGHKKFKDTELGNIPENWGIERLGKIVKIRSGDTPSGFDFNDGNYPFFKVDDMNYSLKYLNKSKLYFTNYRKPLMQKGMVVFPKRGAAIYTNKVRILNTSGYFDTNIMGITGKEIFNEFLYYFILYIGLEKFADTTSIPQINNKHIEPIKIALPGMKEQKQIAEILTSVDDKIQINKKLKNKLTKFKKGLMQDLLTGKVRVK